MRLLKHTTRLKQFLGDESGATAIEYALVATLVSIGILAAMLATGEGVSGLYNAVAEKASGSMGGG